MTVEGVDYAFSWPNPAGLKAAGKAFAMRYVGPGTADKHLTAAERDALHAAGLAIVLLAEGTTGAPMGGPATGVQHASLARDQAAALGAPDTAPIYFAVDFDVSAYQWPTVANYLRGCASVLGVERVGVYGSLAAMSWARAAGVARWFFQTYAWSGGQWSAHNHVEQYHNGVNLAGGQVDLCRAVQANYGQWPLSGGSDMTAPPLTGIDRAQVSNTEHYLQALIGMAPRATGISNMERADLEVGNELAAVLLAIARDVSAIRTAVEALQAAGRPPATSGTVTVQGTLAVAAS